MPKIAIIGAGISGLTTAWYLQKLAPWAQVTLFDSASQVGGVIQTQYSDPFLIELGADNFATLVPDAIQMVEEMGIRDEFISPKTDHRIAQVVRDGKVIPIPNGFSLMQPTRLSSVMTTRVLSVAGRLRVMAEYFVARRNSVEDESVESFAIRRLGRECFERLVEPIVGGIFTARAETLSMKAAMPQFLEMEQKHGGLIRGALAKRKSQASASVSARLATGARYDQFLAPKKGMGWWMKRIAQDLRCTVHLSQRVTKLEEVDESKWRLWGQTFEQKVEHLLGKSKPTTDPAIDGTFDGTFDAIVLAIPSSRAADLLQATRPKLSSLLQRIPYASSAVAVLAIKRSEIPQDRMCFGIVVPKLERRDSLAISLSSEKYEGRCPDDVVLVRVFMGGAVRPELLDKSDDALLEIARKEVRELLGVTSLPRWETLVRWPAAMPQYMVGHTELIKELFTEAANDPTLQLTGNAYNGVGIPQCIRMARKSAEHLASALVNQGN